MGYSNVAWLVRFVVVATSCTTFGKATTRKVRRLNDVPAGQAVTFPFTFSGSAETFTNKAEFNNRCFKFIHSVISRQSISKEDLSKKARVLCVGTSAAQTNRCSAWGVDLWVALATKLQASRHAASAADVEMKGSSSYGEWCEKIYRFQVSSVDTGVKPVEKAHVAVVAAQPPQQPTSQTKASSEPIKAAQKTPVAASPSPLAQPATADVHLSVKPKQPSLAGAPPEKAPSSVPAKATQRSVVEPVKAAHVWHHVVEPVKGAQKATVVEPVKATQQAAVAEPIAPFAKAVSNEPVKASQKATVVEPVKATQKAADIEPAKATQIAAVVEPVKAAHHVDDPVKGAQKAAVIEPVKATQKTAKVEPVVPVVKAVSNEPAKATQKATDIEPGKATQSATVAEPVKAAYVLHKVVEPIKEAQKAEVVEQVKAPRQAAVVVPVVPVVKAISNEPVKASQKATVVEPVKATQKARVVKPVDPASKAVSKETVKANITEPVNATQTAIGSYAAKVVDVKQVADKPTATTGTKMKLAPLVSFPFRSMANSKSVAPFASKPAFQKYCLEFAHSALSIAKSSDEEEFSDTLRSLCQGADEGVCKEWGRDLWGAFISKLQVKPANLRGSRTYDEWCANIYEIKAATPFPMSAYAVVPVAVTMNAVVPVAATQSVSKRVTKVIASKGDVIAAVFPFRLPSPPPGWKPLEPFMSRLAFEHHCFSFIYALGTSVGSNAQGFIDQLEPLCQGAGVQQCKGYASSLWGVFAARAGETKKMQGPGPISYTEWCNKVYGSQLMTPLPKTVVPVTATVAPVTATVAPVATPVVATTAAPVPAAPVVATPSAIPAHKSRTLTRADAATKKAEEMMAAAKKAEDETREMLAAASARRKVKVVAITNATIDAGNQNGLVKIAVVKPVVVVPAAAVAVSRSKTIAPVNSLKLAEHAEQEEEGVQKATETVATSPAPRPSLWERISGSSSSQDDEASEKPVATSGGSISSWFLRMR